MRNANKSPKITKNLKSTSVVNGVSGDDNIIKEFSGYFTIRYDSGYLTCSKKLTGSQLSLPHGINRKLKCETKNKMMSVISPVRSRYREAVQ